MAGDVRGNDYKIQAVKTSNEIERIMRTARSKRQYEEESWVDRITIKKSGRK